MTKYKKRVIKSSSALKKLPMPRTNSVLRSKLQKGAEQPNSRYKKKPARRPTDRDDESTNSDNNYGPPKLELMPSMDEYFEDSDYQLQEQSSAVLKPGKINFICPVQSCLLRFKCVIELVNHFNCKHGDKFAYEFRIFACPFCPTSQYTTPTTSNDLNLIEEHVNFYHGPMGGGAIKLLCTILLGSPASNATSKQQQQQQDNPVTAKSLQAMAQGPATFSIATPSDNNQTLILALSSNKAPHHQPNTLGPLNILPSANQQTAALKPATMLITTNIDASKIAQTTGTASPIFSIITQQAHQTQLPKTHLSANPPAQAYIPISKALTLGSTSAEATNGQIWSKFNLISANHHHHNNNSHNTNSSNKVATTGKSTPLQFIGQQQQQQQPSHLINSAPGIKSASNQILASSLPLVPLNHHHHHQHQPTTIQLATSRPLLSGATHQAVNLLNMTATGGSPGKQQLAKPPASIKDSSPLHTLAWLGSNRAEEMSAAGKLNPVGAKKHALNGPKSAAASSAAISNKFIAMMPSVMKPASTITTMATKTMPSERKAVCSSSPLPIVPAPAKVAAASLSSSVQDTLNTTNSLQALNNGLKSSTNVLTLGPNGTISSTPGLLFGAAPTTKPSVILPSSTTVLHTAAKTSRPKIAIPQANKMHSPGLQKILPKPAAANLTATANHHAFQQQPKIAMRKPDTGTSTTAVNRLKNNKSAPGAIRQQPIFATSANFKKSMPTVEAATMFLARTGDLVLPTGQPFLTQAAALVPTELSKPRDDEEESGIVEDAQEKSLSIDLDHEIDLRVIKQGSSATGTII